MPKGEHLWGILLYYFIQKKSVADAHRILTVAYGDLALSDTTCIYLFTRFKSKDFDVEDKEDSGAPKTLTTHNWSHYFMNIQVRR